MKPGKAETPIPDSYWIVPHKLLAGEYPGSYFEDLARSKVKAFLAGGVTFFVDLTEERELKPYAEIAREEAEKMGLSTVHRRFPIRDAWIPTVERMREILDTLTAAMDEGHVVYVHCYGGIGRTGTVAGCWLVEQGLTAGEALERIRSLRKRTPDGGIRSPENDTQKRFVEDWC